MYTIIDSISFNIKKIKNNKIAKIFICYLFSFAFVKGTSFVLIPFYANFMEKAEYGHFAFLITLLSLFSLLTDLGLNNGLYKYTKHKKRDGLILFNILIISFVVNIMTYAAVVIFISWLHLLPYEVHLDHLTILFLSLIMASFTMLNLTYFRIYNKGLKYLICSVAQPFFHIIIFSILIMADKVSIENLLYSTLVSNIITSLITLFFNKKIYIPSISKRLMFKLVKYTFGTTVSIVALYVLTGLDRFFLAYYITPESLADYSLLMLFASITILLMEPISLWYFANRFKMLENKIRFEKITSYLVILNIWIATIVLINGSFVFNLLLPEIYMLDIVVFMLAILSFHFKYLSTILNIGCYTGKNTNIVAKINVSVAVVTFICIVFLIRDHNSLGVICAILFGYSSILLLNIYCSQKRKYIKYNKNEIIPNYIGSFIVIFTIFDFEMNIIISNIVILFVGILINVKGIRYVKESIPKTENKEVGRLPL